MTKPDWNEIASHDSRILIGMPEPGEFVFVPCTRKDCPTKEPHLEAVEVVSIQISTRRGDFEAGEHSVFIPDPKFLSSQSEN